MTRIKGLIDKIKKFFCNIFKEKNSNVLTENEEVSIDDRTIFYNLSPTKVDSKGIYIKALEYSTSNDEISNIAITGKYGAGKTSIIKTYEEIHKEKNILNVSLASFKDNNMDDEISIERNILQQLFYTVNAKKIPYSRFKRINNLKSLDMIKKLLITAILVISIMITWCLLLNPQSVNKESVINSLKLIKEYYFYSFFRGLITIALLGIFIGSMSIVIYSIYKKIATTIELSNFKLKKENIEIELGKKNADCNSIFNKYLDELIYFFETTNYDIVVIEDLDRFKNCNEVFIELRELNILINKCESIKRKIKFVYAIKDDLFVDKERTKFFDFIIPVIPVINSTNSREKMLEKIRENGLENDISIEYIKDITLYIDDMRILNNVINEFNIYRKNLQISNLISEKLFSIIVLKNLYPKLFSDLQERKGMIYELFTNKKQRLGEYIKQLKEYKRDLQNEERRLKLNKNYSIKNLKMLLWLQITDIIGKDEKRIRINNKYVTEEEFISDKHNIKDLKGANIHYNYTIRTFEQIMEEIPEEYRIDVDEIEERDNVDNIEDDIGALEYEIDNVDRILSKLTLIEDISMINLIKEFGIENILNKEEKENDLLRFLLTNGYISEDYEEYINYFYEGTLKQSDKEFLMNIKAQREMKYDYKLVEKAEVLENLQDKYFETQEILNYDLVDYILQNNEKYIAKTEKLFEQLKNEKKKVIRFCTAYIQRGENIEQFVGKLCDNWNNIWNYFYNNGTYEEKELYLCTILKYADIKTIVKVNETGNLEKTICNKNDFIKIFTTDKEIHKAKEIIKVLDIKFENLDEEDLTSKLGEYIISNNCYIIREEILDAILRQRYKIDDENIKMRNYSSIIETNDSQLIEYIDDNIEEYITNIIMSENKIINDNEKYILRLLNSENIARNQKQDIIKKQRQIIKDINSCNIELWKKLINNNRVNISWNNIISYYLENELDDELISYINLNCEVLSKSKIDEINEFDIETYEKICTDLAKEEKVTEDIIVSITYTVHEGVLNLNLSNSRIKLMIEREILPVQNSTYTLLRENYKELIPNYIEVNVKFFIEEYDNLNCDTDDVKGILLNKNIDVNDKLDIIAILDDNMGCDDIESAKLYYSLLIEHGRHVPIPIRLLQDIMEYLDEEEALKILIDQAEDIEEEDISACLLKLNYPYNEIPTKSIPKIKKSKITDKFIEMLRMKKISYISTIKEKPEYYIVNKRRK